MQPASTLLFRLLLIGAAGLACFSLRDIAFPGRAVSGHINGAPIRITFAAPNGVSLGKQLPIVTRLFPALPCSVQISLDTSLQDTYGTDGVIVATAAHEIGHCMEQRLQGRRSRMHHPQPMDGWSADKAASEAYADSWASLYLIRCGVNLAPMGYPDAEGRQLRGAALSTAQSCVPRPEEALSYRDPLTVIQTLRAASGYSANGITPVSPLMRELGRGEAAAMGINLAALPPAHLSPQNGQERAWISGERRYVPPGDQRALTVPSGTRREQLLWAKSRLHPRPTLEAK